MIFLIFYFFTVNRDLCLMTMRMNAIYKRNQEKALLVQNYFEILKITKIKLVSLNFSVPTKLKLINAYCVCSCKI